MPSYEIHEDDWGELRNQREEQDGARAESNLPLAIEAETGYVFRDLKGEEFHRYPFADQKYDVSWLRHYLMYASVTKAEWTDFSTFKGRMLTAAAMVLRAIAKVRKQVTVMEIGSTIGENFLLLQQLIDYYKLDLELDYTGIEISPNLVQFSYIIHRGNERWKSYARDAADLGGFPDRCFDVVISQGVANFAANQPLAFSEIVRVARVATILGCQLTTADKGFWLTRDIGYSTWLPTFDELLEIWKKHAPVYDYTLTRWDWTETATSGSGAERFVGVDAAEIESVFEYHILAKHPMFPNMEKICRKIG